MTRVLTTVIVGALLAGCAARSGSPLRHDAGTAIPLTYLATAKPIRLEGAELHTYAIVPTPMREDRLRDLSGRLGKDAGVALTRMRDGDAGDGRAVFATAADPSATLNVDVGTGDLLFNAGLGAYRNEGSTPSLPNERDAERLARAHARRLGLLPEDSELVLAHVGGVNMGAHRADGTTDLYRKLVTVRFDRRLNGMPVLGYSRLQVGLGARGAVRSVVRRWSRVEGRPVRREELIAAETIAHAIEARLLTEAKGAERIVVKKTDLVLYDHGGGVIEPAIHVVASLHYEAPVVNSRVVGERRRLEVPYDTFEPVLKDHRAVYPFMHAPDAAKRIADDAPSAIPARETAPADPR